MWMQWVREWEVGMFSADCLPDLGGCREKEAERKEQMGLRKQ